MANPSDAAKRAAGEIRARFHKPIAPGGSPDRDPVAEIIQREMDARESRLLEAAWAAAASLPALIEYCQTHDATWGDKDCVTCRGGVAALASLRGALR